MNTEVETQLVSVERLSEYTTLEQEADYRIPHAKPDDEWPFNGNIVFKNVKIRYRAGLELVLRGITCTLQGHEKVGVCGRTGAGKSSLMLALFRLVELADGQIFIDDIDISKIGLEDLRKNLSIIPQDPTLFAGTIRTNLDPFSAYTDLQLWQALENVHLRRFVEGLEGGMASPVSEGGENLSVGQRQLMCLGRALLKKTKILVMDEATAAVDFETDSLIQKTIREQFAGVTVLTIAHRINTIMDYDKILVLDRGLMVEFDSPENLLKDKNGVFYSLVHESGKQ